MKTQIFAGLFFSLAMLLIIKSGHAQSYALSSRTGTYSNLTGNTSITNNKTWDSDVFGGPIGFNFKFYGTNYTSLFITADGIITFDYNITLQEGTKFFMGFFADLVDKGSIDGGDGTGVSKSDISYLLSGSAGSRIFKIQFKNAAFYQSPGDYVNFQIWLYETSNKIEVWVGSNSITNPAQSYTLSNEKGPAVGVVIQDPSTSNILYSIMADGNPSAPVASSWTDTQSAPVALTGTPANGRIYEFSPTASTGINESEINTDITLFPNPSSSPTTTLALELKAEEDVTIIIYNLLGEQVYTEQKGNLAAGKNVFTISTGNLTRGMYNVTVLAGKEIVTRKLVLE